MKFPRLVVCSTVVKAPYSVARCVRSVRDQSHPSHHVVWTEDPQTQGFALDAARSFAGIGSSTTEVRDFVRPRAARFENLLPLWRELDPTDVIVWLDGDDWLACPHALKVIALAHARGALITYGSYLMPDGSPGHIRAPGEHPRKEPWGASHLKTFRAGLVQRIRDEDYREADGRYSSEVADLRVMWPCLELAPRHAHYVRNMLVVYNYETSFYANAMPDEKAREEAEGLRVRSFDTYDPLTNRELRELGADPEADLRPSVRTLDAARQHVEV